jgi:multiple sugar transport system permease protein
MRGAGAPVPACRRRFGPAGGGCRCHASSRFPRQGAGNPILLHAEEPALDSTDRGAASREDALRAPAAQEPGTHPRTSIFEDETVLGYALLVPALLIIFIFKAYPFGLGIWFSLTSKLVGDPGDFIGLDNYFKIMHSQIFWQTAWNTIFFTTMATIFKSALGMWLALILYRKFAFSRVTRAVILLPFIVPTVLSGLAWLWMFDATFSVFNWMINWVWKLDLSVGDLVLKTAWPGRFRINWLGEPGWAMFSVIAVNVWRGMPFFAISFLAGLQTVPPDLYDAGDIDGANGWQRFWRITLPMIKPIAVVVVVFSIVVTFADFEVVYVLTRGGPANSTHLFATLAYQLGMASGNLGEGAAIALFMLPILAALIVWQLLYLRREQEQ